MTNEKTGRLGKLNQKISDLKDKKAALDAKARKWSKRRDELNERVKNLGAEIKKLRDKRDRLNQKVQDLKETREKTKGEIKKKIREIRKLNQRIEPLTQKKSSKPLPALQEEVQEKEWRIQTTSMSLQEEKRMVNQVQQLGKQIDLHKKLNTLYQKKRKLQSELEDIKTQNRLSHKKMMKKAERSQEFHQKMIKKIEKSEKLATKADQMHQRFMEAKKTVTPVQKEIAKVSDQIEQLKAERQKTLKREIGEKAREKLGQGERLTFEEFKILVEGEDEKQN